MVFFLNGEFVGEYNFVTCVYVHMIYKTGLPGYLLTILKRARVCVCVHVCVPSSGSAGPDDSDLRAATAGTLASKGGLSLAK